MRKYNISANIVRTTEQLYDNATCANQMNDKIGELVHNNSRCSVTHPLNFFLERIMSVALEEHDVTVSIRGRNITYLRFADDTDAL